MASQADVKAARIARVKAFQERVKKPELFQLDPKVPITLKGTVYTLEFDLRAAKDVLEDSGFNMLSTNFIEAYENPDVLGAVLHRGLQLHHESMTREQADRLFSMKHHPYITEMIGEAMTLFNPDLSDVPVPEQDEAPAVDPQP